MLRATACGREKEDKLAKRRKGNGEKGRKREERGGKATKRDEEQDNERGEQTHVNETLMYTPAVDNAPLDVPLALDCFRRLLPFAVRPDDLPPHLVQAAARRRAAVLRVLRERDRPLHAVPSHLVKARLGQRLSVAEGDVSLVRRRFRRELVEKLDHAVALRPSPLEDGRAASNGGVLLFNLGRSTFRNVGSDSRLKR
jgi:hypothetical protein